MHLGRKKKKQSTIVDQGKTTKQISSSSSKTHHLYLFNLVSNETAECKLSVNISVTEHVYFLRTALAVTVSSLLPILNTRPQVHFRPDALTGTDRRLV